MYKELRIKQTGFNNRYNSWHTLNQNMILYVHSGKGSIFHREGCYPLVSGCICFVGANKLYYTLPDDPAEYTRSKLFLSDRELEAVLRLFPEELEMGERFFSGNLVYACLKGENAAWAESVFDGLEKYMDRPDYLQAMCTAAFTQLLAALNENATDRTFPAAGIVQKAIEYINTHLHEEISIDEICRYIPVSKYYFCKKFKQVTGLTVMRYILKIRIDTAKNMLENTDLFVGQISERCGFSSQSYFCRVFKEALGITPLQYQKRT